MKLSKKKKGHNMIWVIINRLTKIALFLATHETWSMKKFLELKIMKKHGVPFLSSSDQTSRVTSQFWRSTQEDLGIMLCLNTTYHTKIDR